MKSLVRHALMLLVVIALTAPAPALIAGLAVLAVLASPSAHAQNQSAQIAYFENHVRPLLSKHCFECHNDKKQEGGVRLDIREELMKGGESGPAVVAGKPEESLMIEAVRYEGLEMPPDEPLAPEQIDVLVKWVRQGAIWPQESNATKPSLGDQDAIRKVADSHWSFRQIDKQPLPDTADPDWASHPIDRFVLSKLESNGLAPSPAATRTVLIRRAFYDLIGLPPTPETVVEVMGPDGLKGKTYKEIVTCLLSSDHYGERMARHWMDIARYADTRDFLAAADLRYPFAYTYRDWLINAFNQDMPFDDFVRYQLAADHMAENDRDPNLAALGFLTVGPLFRNNTLERVADRVDVVTRGLMGLTGSCARCHDHKYDPISIEDYYSLYGVFRDSVRPKEFPTIDDPLGNKVSDELVAEFEKALGGEKQKLLDYENGLAQAALKSFQERAAEYLVSYIELSIAKSETTRGLKTKRSIEETALTPIAANLDAFRREKKNASHPILGPIVVLFSVDDESFEQRKTAYLKRSGGELNPLVRAVVDAAGTRVDLANGFGKLLTEATTSKSESMQPIRKLVIDPSDGPFVITAKAASGASRLLGKGRQTLLKYHSAIADVEATHAGAPPKAMVLSDAKRMAPIFVMYRGEAARRGPKVERGFLKYFSQDDASRFEQGSGRFELAEKIVAPGNPLTARVIVNRVWNMHFGRGLVSDAGDFGLRSEPPEQLELLNWIARSLVEHDWSIKWLHQTIMLSKTYRQASSTLAPSMRDDGTSAAEIDSTNQLLWRQNRRRADFESMRDSMLSAAGTLDRSIGGPSVELDAVPSPTRRTVYSYVDRVDPNPLFATFDVPSASVSAAQRSETLVPQQALFAMNNSFVTDQARAIVARQDFRDAKTRNERIDVLFRRIYPRSALSPEYAMIGNFIDAASKMNGQRSPVWMYGFGPVDGSVDQFTALEYFDGKRYSYEKTFPSATHGYIQLTRVGGHPGRSSDHASIRRWVAPAAMTIRIAGTLGRASERGDGIRAVVKINGEVVHQSELMTGTTKTVCGFHDVKAGDIVDFVVDPKATTTSDGYRWTVLIEHRSRTKKDVVQSWQSGQDFAGPPAAPMSPWEQTAQALMMTNEFLFVD